MGVDPLLEGVRRTVTALGFELIEFRKAGPPGCPSIQVRIDRPGSQPGAGVTAGDCAQVSRALEPWFEGEAAVGRRYRLTVSSPGLERPVRFPEHWRQYLGRTVRLTARGVPGHPQAVIAGVPADDRVRLRFSDGGERDVALDAIKEALLQGGDPSGGGPAAS
jgi:ribosome maturation factor RimP